MNRLSGMRLKNALNGFDRGLLIRSDAGHSTEDIAKLGVCARPMGMRSRSTKETVPEGPIG